MNLQFTDPVSFMALMGDNITLTSRDTWFSVEGRLQRIDISRLLLVSPILRDATTAASQNGPMSEGTQEHPLFLPSSIPYPVFRDFIGWFLRMSGVLDDDLTLTQLENILEMSHYWAIDFGQTFGASKIAGIANLSASYRMMLARRYDLDHWVNGLTVELFNLSHEMITGKEIIECSTDVWAVIDKAREQYQQSLNVLAIIPPNLPKEGPHYFLPYCPNHKACVCEWELVWYSKIGRRLLIEDERKLQPGDILEHICSLQYPQMNRECRRDALELLQESRNVFLLKENVEAAAILGVRRVLGLPTLPEA